MSRPTAWAYEQACAAREKHRQRAETAEAEVERLKARLADEHYGRWHHADRGGKCLDDCPRCERRGLIERVKFTKDFERLKAERDELKELARMWSDPTPELAALREALAQEIRLTKDLTTLRDQIRSLVEEMKAEDWSQHAVQPASVESVVNTWAARLAALVQTEK